MATNDLTIIYENLVIDRAKRNYLAAFKAVFPNKSHYTLNNINMSRKPGHNNFTLYMCNKWGRIVHEEDFCFSDF